MPRVSLTEQPRSARFIFRGRGPAVAAAGAAFGIELPQQPCRAAETGPHAALWLGPDEWLLIAPHGARDGVWRDIATRLGSVPHSLVDVSDRQVAVLVSGADAEHALSAGCPLDLDITAFPVGACTRTVLGKTEIVLWRRTQKSFHLEVWRSFAAYLNAFLEEAILGLERV
jgi:sarcosine oxidase, subunit gamma